MTAGLFDLQVNGYAGIDFNDPAVTPDALDTALEAMLRSGVTRCLPTLITAHEPELAERLAALDEAVRRSRLGPLMVPGFHLEGPFLNRGDGFAGCHPTAAMTPPDPALLDRISAGLQRKILLLTLAPELPGAEALIRTAVASGIVVALGHHGAGVDIVAAAAAAGACLSTHLGNATPHTANKFDNPIMAQLAEDRLAASFIADGIHVPPFALKAMMRAKGFDRCALVTDATAGAAARPGIFGFAGMDIERTVDGAVRLPGTTRLAGSALELDAAVRNVAVWGITDPATALAMASSVPSRVMRTALSARGMELPDSEVIWSSDIRAAVTRIGDVVFQQPGVGL